MRTRRVRVATNDGRTVSGYQRGDLIAYLDTDGLTDFWTVERGRASPVPKSPDLVGRDLTRTKALELLRAMQE